MKIKKKRCYARPRTCTLGLTEAQPLLVGSAINHGAQGAGISIVNYNEDEATDVLFE